MPIYLRQLKKGPRYWVDGQHLGVRFHSKAIFGTKGEARAWERERMREIEEEAKRPRPEITLLELMNFRLDDIEAKKSRKYLDENRLYFKRFLDFTGRERLAGDITKAEANKFLILQAKEFKQRGRTNHKLNATIRILKALYGFGMKFHDLRENPFAGTEMFPIQIKLKHILTDRKVPAAMKWATRQERLLGLYN